MNTQTHLQEHQSHQGHPREVNKGYKEHQPGWGKEEPKKETPSREHKGKATSMTESQEPGGNKSARSK